MAISYSVAGHIAGSGTWCFDAGAEYDRTTVTGSRGTLSMSISAPEPIRLSRGTHVEYLDIADPPHVHEPLLRRIVDEWTGAGHCPSTGATATRTAVVMDTVLASLGPRQ